MSHPALPTPGQPVVTVVTVIFNLLKAGRAEQFRQCVESVHAQCYEAIDHLVIDGASTDGTRELVAEYEARGWLRCLSEPDSGIYDAMNKGLRHARGKYAAFLNSDDFWHSPQAVASSVHHLEETQADFSYAPHTAITEEGALAFTREPSLGACVGTMPFCHQTMFCRVDRMLTLGGFDAQHYRIYADYDLITRLLLSGAKGVYNPLNFTSFRLGGASGPQFTARLQEEHHQMFMRHYAPLLGVEEGSPFDENHLPAHLLPALAARLHPQVFAQVSHHIHQPAPGLPLAPIRESTSKWKGPLGLSLLTHRRPAGGKAGHWLLFGFLPLLSTIQSSPLGSGNLHRSYKLFGLLPLWKIKEIPGISRKHYALGCIPIGSGKHSG